MPKHSEVVPINAKRQNSPKEVLVPTRNGTFVQISFPELLLRYFQQPQAQQTVRPETRAQRRAKIVYLPKRSCDDSCNT